MSTDTASAAENDTAAGVVPKDYRAPKSRFSKSGQPVMSSGLMLEAENEKGPVGWIPVTVVGKLFGRGGNSDLVGLIVEWPDGGRQTVAWPFPHRRI